MSFKVTEKKTETIPARRATKAQQEQLNNLAVRLKKDRTVTQCLAEDILLEVLDLVDAGNADKVKVSELKAIRSIV